MLQHGGFLHPTLDQPEVLDHLCRSGVSNEVQINGRERPADIFVDRWTTPDPAAVDVISTKSAGGAAQFKSSQVKLTPKFNPIQSNPACSTNSAAIPSQRGGFEEQDGERS